jgi:membrane protease YdiL (CAAX protease family)
MVLKLFIIYVYLLRKPSIFEMGRGDEIFQYFTNDLNHGKLVSLTLLFPLSAFVEELIYRSLILSALIYYFDFNFGMGILAGSILFSFVHTTALRNTGQIISLLISSLIYFAALIQLGILFAWSFHLMTNLIVLLFYYKRRMKALKYEN